VALLVRPRTLSHTALRYLLSAGAAAVLLVSSCLNPQPDDFPQSSDGPVPSNERAARPPADVELAPAEGSGAATAPAPSAPPTVNSNDQAPASAAPSDGLSAAADDDADAGAPADAGLSDAALVVAQ